MHFVALEKLSFLKYPQISALEAHHGLDIGASYLKIVHYLEY